MMFILALAGLQVSWLFGCADKLAALCTLPRRRTLGLRTGGFSYVMLFGLISALLLNKEVPLNCLY